LDLHETGTLQVCDITGQELLRVKMSTNPITFNRSGLASGVYLLSVINQQGRVLARDKMVVK
jgi:hypothetical protein